MKRLITLLITMLLAGCGPDLELSPEEEYALHCDQAPNFIGVRHYDPEGYLCCYALIDDDGHPFVTCHHY